MGKHTAYFFLRKAYDNPSKTPTIFTTKAPLKEKNNLQSKFNDTKIEPISH